MLAQFQSFDRKIVHQLYRTRVDYLAGTNIEKRMLAKPSIEPGGKWACTVCDLVYDTVKGNPEHGIALRTSFEDIPDDWVYPLCGATKSAFRKL